MNLINEEIRSKQVRLVGVPSEVEGIMSLSEALEYAYSEGMDLVEMSCKDDVSICKVFDYQKFLYAQKKKKVTQKKVVLKEIKLGCNIMEHDLRTSCKKAENILSGGDRVKVSVVFKGRQKAYIDVFGPKVMNQFMCIMKENRENIEIVKSVYKEGNTYTCIIQG